MVIFILLQRSVLFHCFSPTLFLVKYPLDISLFIDKKMKDEERFNVISNHYRPLKSYSFPVNSDKRSFQVAWLDRFSWLAYSAIENGAYCIPCVLFGRRDGHNSSKVERLYQVPFTDWSNAIRRFKDHESKSPLHKAAVVDQSNFSTVMSNAQDDVTLQLNFARKIRM